MKIIMKFTKIIIANSLKFRPKFIII